METKIVKKILRQLFREFRDEMEEKGIYIYNDEPEKFMRLFIEWIEK